MVCANQTEIDLLVRTYALSIPYAPLLARHMLTPVIKVLSVLIAISGSAPVDAAPVWCVASLLAKRE